MTSWTASPLACFDIESTGVDVTKDRVVTAFLGRINGADVIRKHWIVDPGIEIPTEATAVHGITTEYAQAYGRPHEEAVPEIVEHLCEAWNSGYVIAGYNLSYDLSLLATWAPGFEIRGPIFDGLVVDKRYDTYRKGSRKLSAVAIHYGVRLDDAHDAEGDAVAAARLAWKMPRVYPHLASLTATELMDQQAVWAREQAESFIDYLKKQGKPHDDVRTEWPIARRAEVEAA